MTLIVNFTEKVLNSNANNEDNKCMISYVNSEYCYIKWVS